MEHSLRALILKTYTMLFLRRLPSQEYETYNQLVEFFGKVTISLAQPYMTLPMIALSAQKEITL